MIINALKCMFQKLLHRDRTTYTMLRNGGEVLGKLRVQIQNTINNKRFRRGLVKPTTKKTTQGIHLKMKLQHAQTVPAFGGDFSQSVARTEADRFRNTRRSRVVDLPKSEVDNMLARAGVSTEQMLRAMPWR